VSARPARPSEVAAPHAPDLPDELPALPIFPLPNCVLLPGGMLPLHVFEPRYRALTRACLAGDHLMAIASLRPGYQADYEGRTPVHRVAGVGRIICADELPDGRFMLLLQGVGRVEIEDELPPTEPYRVVRARAVRDAAPGDRVRYAATYERLRGLCDQLALALDASGHQAGQQLRQLAACDTSAGFCADAVAAALIVETSARQRLLEECCPETRLRATIDAVTQLLCALAPCHGDVN
jgi:Lon protease-like protein